MGGGGVAWEGGLTDRGLGVGERACWRRLIRDWGSEGSLATGIGALAPDGDLPEAGLGGSITPVASNCYWLNQLAGC